MKQPFSPVNESWPDYDAGLLKDFFDHLNSAGVFNEDIMEELYSTSAAFMAERSPNKSHAEWKKEILK